MTTKAQAKTLAIFNYLKRCAAQKRIVTYTEVGAEVGLIARAVANPHLYHIGGEFRKRGFPPLDALVVLKRDCLPGEGFKPDGTRVTKAEHAEMVCEVFAFDWSSVDIPI